MSNNENNILTYDGGNRGTTDRYINQVRKMKLFELGWELVFEKRPKFDLKFGPIRSKSIGYI